VEIVDEADLRVPLREVPVRELVDRLAVHLHFVLFSEHAPVLLYILLGVMHSVTTRTEEVSGFFGRSTW
jgi:hypothetical protein